MPRSKRPTRPRPPAADAPVDPADASLFHEAMRQLDVVPKTRDHTAEPSLKAADPTPVPRPSVDPADALLFHEAMRQLEVESDQDQEPAADPPAPNSAPTLTSDSAPPSASPSPSVDPADVSLFMRAMRRLDVVPDKDRGWAAAVADGVRRRRAPKLGTLKVDDRFDLHGQRVDDALVRLAHFVERAAHRRLRTVVIVTGKGHHSPGGIAVLRRAVEDWIRREGRGRVEAYSDGPRDEGGRGAFVLYLRRPREA